MDERVERYRALWTNEKDLHYLVVGLPDGYTLSALIFAGDPPGPVMIDDEAAVVEEVIRRMKASGVQQYTWPDGMDPMTSWGKDGSA